MCASGPTFVKVPDHRVIMSNSNDQHRFQVIVGNIGTVVSSNNLLAAITVYWQYVQLALAPTGRASGEEVVFIYDGEIVGDYHLLGTNES